MHWNYRVMRKVMEPGSLLYVTGNSGNQFARAVEPATAQAMGFEPQQTAPMHAAHNFGIQRYTSGGALRTENSTTTIYRRIGQ